MTNEPQSKILLTPDEVCDMLGVTATWLGAETRDGRIPHVRLGKKKLIRFRPEQIEEYLNSRTIHAHQEEEENQ